MNYKNIDKWGNKQLKSPQPGPWGPKWFPGGGDDDGAKQASGARRETGI